MFLASFGSYQATRYLFLLTINQLTNSHDTWLWILAIVLFENTQDYRMKFCFFLLQIHVREHKMFCAE